LPRPMSPGHWHQPAPADSWCRCPGRVQNLFLYQLKYQFILMISFSWFIWEQN
jgi:hypothetical protein